MQLEPVCGEAEFADLSFDEKYEVYVEKRQETLKKAKEEGTDKDCCLPTNGFSIRLETGLEPEILRERIREIGATKIEMFTKEQFAYLMGEE